MRHPTTVTDTATRRGGCRNFLPAARSPSAIFTRCDGIVAAGVRSCTALVGICSHSNPTKPQMFLCQTVALQAQKDPAVLILLQCVLYPENATVKRARLSCSRSHICAQCRWAKPSHEWLRDRQQRSLPHSSSLRHQR